MPTQTTAKPRFSPTSNGLRIVFADGRVADLFPSTQDLGAWRGTVTEVNGREHTIHAHGRDHAVRAAYCAGVQAPDALALVDAEATADAAETLAVSEVTKLLRQLLRARTGRSWSVRKGSGTSGSWIHIGGPSARALESGAMSHADQATLASIFGECSTGGISVRTERGVRAYYACRAAGLALPQGVTVAPPGWD